MRLLFFFSVSMLLCIETFSQPFLHDLVISEFLADPDPPNFLPDAEFVEIHNRSQQAFSLNGWILYDGSNRQLPSVTINPGQYIIICASSDTSLFAGWGPVAGISSLSLTNTGEKISLRDPNGVPVDSVLYSDAWFGSSFKKDGGWSLEKVDLDFNCAIASNWKPSENYLGGTPGKENSVNGVFVDEDPPVLLRAFCSDSNEVQLVFNEPINITGISNSSNYLITPSVPVASALPADETNTRVIIELNTVIQPGTYQIVINNLTDCSGNVIDNSEPVFFGLPEMPGIHDLVINEILFNPYEYGTDYIEIFNNGNHTIDLSKLRIAAIDEITGEPDEVAVISDETWLLFPGEYAVLSESALQVAAQYKSSFPFSFIDLEEMPSMNADKGFIALIYEGNRMDQFSYSEEYHFALLEDVKGVSLEKINPSGLSSDISSWHSASYTSGFGTPGLKNSQYQDAVQSNDEVYLFPEIFSPDNDGRDDVLTFIINSGTGNLFNFRIVNRYGQIVYDHSKNYLISAGDSFGWDGIGNKGEKIPAGIYVALIEIVNLNGDVKNYKLPFVLAVTL